MAAVLLVWRVNAEGMLVAGAADNAAAAALSSWLCSALCVLLLVAVSVLIQVVCICDKIRLIQITRTMAILAMQWTCTVEECTAYECVGLCLPCALCLALLLLLPDKLVFGEFSMRQGMRQTS